ncbi:MAG: hypothetical protein R3188_02075 [Acidiferrobacterales bacterium]|nr:hypothetical protein [Acidiferrobacterales bacterium]
MNTIVMNNVIEADGPYCPVPTTPRGRALHTVDWFLNGKPTLNNHDEPSIKVQDVRGR